MIKNGNLYFGDQLLALKKVIEEYYQCKLDRITIDFTNDQIIMDAYAIPKEPIEFIPLNFIASNSSIDFERLNNE